MEETKKNREKNIVTNRKARFNYEIVDSFEAGVVLLGSEVKSHRPQNYQLSHS